MREREREIIKRERERERGHYDINQSRQIRFTGHTSLNRHLRKDGDKKLLERLNQPKKNSLTSPLLSDFLFRRSIGGRRKVPVV